MEIWKQSPSLPDGYEVSSEGRVRRGAITYLGTTKRGALTPRIMPPKIYALRSLSGRGYKRVNICNRAWFAHRLIAEAFIPNPKSLPMVNHLNGIKTDNSVENLEWTTDEANKQHAQAMRLYQYGEQSHQCRLPLAAIEQIKGMVASGISQREVADQFGCSQQYVSKIVRGIARCFG